MCSFAKGKAAKKTLLVDIFYPYFLGLFSKVMDSPLFVKYLVVLPGNTGRNKSKKTVGGGWGLTYLLPIIPTVSPANHLTSCVAKSRETTFRNDH